LVYNPAMKQALKIPILVVLFTLLSINIFFLVARIYGFLTRNQEYDSAGCWGCPSLPDIGYFISAPLISLTGAFFITRYIKRRLDK
jgi:hypothetical protein